jgi:HAE1 family hydrophobic/amphiphilic exporter-1
MSLISLAVKRPIGTIMVYTGIILLGVISLMNLSVNLMPDLSYPKLTVLTQYPGSGPEEIERFITDQLEGPLGSIKGLKEMKSTSKEGSSIITLEFHWGTDMDFALLHTKEKIEESRRSLPDDCETPILLEWDPSSSPVLITILRTKPAENGMSPRSIDELKEAAEYIIKPRLEQLEGISRVEIRGGNDQEVSVEIDPERIKNLGITLAEVASSINANNVFQSGGTVKKDKLRYTLKVEGEVRRPEEIEQIVVRQFSGRSIQIRDIGRAYYKPKLKQGDIRLDETPSIALLLYRESAGNTVQATQNAEKAFEEMGAEFKDLAFFTIAREADLILSSINSLNGSLILGGILAFVVLLMFLQNYRDPSYISAVIPISIISTFVLMYLFDIQLNIMSLGGLVLGVGMFVDNSIIVLEALFRYRSSSNPMEAVIRGAKEVSGSITASTLTTISIFVPVIYLYGITGRLFRDQALTVSFSLLSSLVVAITLLPALSAFHHSFQHKFNDSLGQFSWIPQKRSLRLAVAPLKGLNAVLTFILRILGQLIYYIIVVFIGGPFLLLRFIGKGLMSFFKLLFPPFNALYQRFDALYHRILDRFMAKKVLALYLALAMISGIALSLWFIDKELLPSPDSTKFEVKASTLPIYGFEETDRIAKEIEQKIKAMPEVDFVFSEAGAVSNFAARSEDFSVNSIHFIISCQSTGKRRSVMDRVRTLLTQYELTDYSLYLEKNTLSQYLAMEGENFQIKVFYEEIENGKEAVRRIMDRIKDLPLNELGSTTSEGKPLYVIRFKQDLLDQMGITKQQISAFINQAVRGEKAGELRLTQKNYDIYVRVPIDGVMAMKDLLELPLYAGQSTYYLKDLVTVEERPSIKEITREAQERYFLITGQVESARLDAIIRQSEQRLESVKMPNDTRFGFAGEETERRKAFDSLNQAMILAVLLVYRIMAAQFENLLQPFIIMFTVPMGLFGAFAALLLFGHSLNIISGIGFLVLVGIGVNDAIVKIEYANQKRAEGKGVRQAIMEASKVRLRPILMTSLTTIFGLIPMAVMPGTGSELQRPLALVLIGGLICTTLLTLLFIPVCYEIVEGYKERKAARRKEAAHA